MRGLGDSAIWPREHALRHSTYSTKCENTSIYCTRQYISDCWLFPCLGSVTWWIVRPTWHSFLLIYVFLIIFPGLFEFVFCWQFPKHRQKWYIKAVWSMFLSSHVWNSPEKRLLEDKELGSYFTQWVEFCCYSQGGWLCWELCFEKVVELLSWLQDCTFSTLSFFLLYLYVCALSIASF